MKLPARRLIEPPSRTSLSGTVFILLTTLLFSITPFSPCFRGPAALAAFLLMAAALLARQFQAFHYALLFTLIAAVPAVDSRLSVWPFALLVPLLLYVIAVLPVSRLRLSLSWIRSGKLDGDILALVAAIGLISGIGLYFWYRLTAPDLSGHLAFMPDMDAWVYPLAGAGFAIGNAAMEEFLFRGVVMHSLDSAFAPGSFSIVVQAWLFGAMHYLRGFPNGWWGVAMASVYGIMLGMIRRRSGGMLAPWLAHVFADLVIFAILAAIILK
jgi:hypothetical protein